MSRLLVWAARSDAGSLLVVAEDREEEREGSKSFS